jgi:hypothetical protein
VRVGTTGGQSHSGTLVHLLPGSLSLQTSSGQALNLLMEDVQRVESKKRSPGTGALVGLGVGALSGGIFLAHVCTVNEEEDQNLTLPCAGGGALLGGALGAGAGALLGLMVPHWSTLYEKRTQGPLPLPPETAGEEPLEPSLSGQAPWGEVGVQLGGAQSLGSDSSTGWGGRLHVMGLAGSHVALGSEAGWYGGMTSRLPSSGGPALQENHALFQLGVLLRLGAAFGPVKPSLLGGVAYVHTRSGHIGASVGGELEVRFWKSLPPLAFEVRYHEILEGSPFQSEPDFLTFGLGSRLRW